jgi:hypothetical protein
MSDVIVIEQCCHCRRNLAVDRLVYNENRRIYYCADGEDCRLAQGQNRGSGGWDGGGGGDPGRSTFKLHYRQSGCGRALLGLFVGISVFFGSWGYAIKTYGWVLGLGLGWLPALFLGILAATFWPAALLIILVLLIFSR